MPTVAARRASCSSACSASPRDDVADCSAELRGGDAAPRRRDRRASSAGGVGRSRSSSSTTCSPARVSDAERDAIRSAAASSLRGTFDRAEAEAWDAELGRLPRTQRVPASGSSRSIPAPPTALPDLAGLLVAPAGRRPASTTAWAPSAASSTGSGRSSRRRALVRARPRHRLPRPHPAARAGRRVQGAGGPRRLAVGRAGGASPRTRRCSPRCSPGGLDAYDPFDAAHRTGADVESPVGCTVFRTFQGWTALSEMRPDDGVLHVVPIPAAVGYRLVHGLAGELGLLGASRSRRRAATPATSCCTRALVPIPRVEPGDTVWWHGDLYHSVGDAANDSRWGNVMYIGAAPRCPRNDAYRADDVRPLRRAVPARSTSRPTTSRSTSPAAPPSTTWTTIGRAQFGARPTCMRAPSLGRCQRDVTDCRARGISVREQDRPVVCGRYCRGRPGLPSSSSKEPSPSYDDDRNPCRSRRGVGAGGVRRRGGGVVRDDRSQADRPHLPGLRPARAARRRACSACCSASSGRPTAELFDSGSLLQMFQAQRVGLAFAGRHPAHARALDRGRPAPARRPPDRLPAPRPHRLLHLARRPGVDVRRARPQRRDRRR